MMWNQILFIFSLIDYVRSDLKLKFKEQALGCVIKDNICQPCEYIGQADCNDIKPQCDYGFFLYTLTESQNGDELYHCVQCPYYEFKDNLSLYCMDCVENPYTWDNYRRCSYDYLILNGDADYGVYSKVIRPTPEVYFIYNTEVNMSNQSTQQTPKSPSYQVYLCDGCDKICFSNQDNDCHPIKVSTQSQYAKCFQNYYYNIDYAMCKTCIPNCQRCTSSSNCQSCQTSYFLSVQKNAKSSSSVNFSCISCSDTIPNCQSCAYSSSGSLQCKFCVKDITGINRIPSLNQKKCEICGSYCQRCEYVTYISPDTIKQQYPTRFNYTDDQILVQMNNYIKRCRQCFNGYSLSYNGVDCVKCSISDCNQCYYRYEITDLQGKKSNFSTLDLDFTPTSTKQIQLCYRCNDGFDLQNDKVCVPKAKQNNCSSYKDGVCVSCSKNIFYNVNRKECTLYEPNSIALINFTKNDGKWVSKNLTNSQYQADLVLNGTIITCADQIQGCQECYLYSITFQDGNPTAQYRYQCVTCDSGYYPDISKGTCELCSNDTFCQTCYQYSPTYNITQYLTTYPQIQEDFIDLITSTEMIYLTPFCTKCTKDSTYLPYYNKCTKCGDNCLSGACQLTETNQYCSKCLSINQLQKSLTDDSSQCLECPEKCLACRNRDDSEIQKINPKFNPQLSSIQIYSRLCYLTNGAYIDSEVGLPVDCQKSQKCQNLLTIEINMYCISAEYTGKKNSQTLGQYDYDLTTFFNAKVNGRYQITFEEIDSSTIYSQLNKNVIKKLDFLINFIATVGECTIVDETNIKVEIQQNVFSLKQFNLYLLGRNITTNKGFTQQFSQTVPPLQNSTSTVMFINKFLYILGIQNLTIQGFTFAYPYDCSVIYTSSQIWGIKVINDQLTAVTIQNVTFGGDYKYLGQFQKGDADLEFTKNKLILFQLKLVNVNSVNLQGVQFMYNNFESLPGNGIIEQNFTTSMIDERMLVLNGVRFIGVSQSSQSIFNLNHIEQMTTITQILGDGLLFLHCQFYDGAHIFSDDLTSSNDSGIIQIFDKAPIIVNYSQFDSSAIFSLSGNINSQKILLSNINIYGCTFNNFSYAFYLNNFKLFNIIIYKSTVTTNSQLFRNQRSISSSDEVQRKSTNYNFQRVKIIGTLCQSLNCIMTIQGTIDEIQPNITLYQFYLLNTSLDIDYFAGNYTASILNAHIILTTIGEIKIDGFISDNNPAATIIAIIQVDYVEVYNSTFDWSNMVQSNKDFLKLRSDNYNSLFPTSIECVTKKFENLAFTGTQIYIQEYVYGILLMYIKIQNMFMIDAAAIQIVSYSINQKNTTKDSENYRQPFSNNVIDDLLPNFASMTQTELFTLVGCSFSDNRILVVGSDQKSSLFMVYSEQVVRLFINNNTWKNNHMHLIGSVQNVPSTTCLLIQSFSGYLVILNSKFIENAATSTQKGIIYIQANQFLISKCSFIETNWFDPDWIFTLEQNDQFEKYDLKNESLSKLGIMQAKNFFSVQAEGGIIQAQSSQFIANQCIFNKSNGQSGGALYIQTFEEGIVVIQDSVFLDIISSLESNDLTTGGGLQIDSEFSKLNLTITNILMKNCQARVSGGCIYLNTFYYQSVIQISSSKFIDCLSLTSTVLNAQFSEQTDLQPKVSLSSIYITYSSMQVVFNFLDSLPLIIDYELLAFISEQPTVLIQQNYGSLSLLDVTIKQVSFMGFLRCTSMNLIQLENIIVQDHTLIGQNLIYFDLLQEYQGEIQIVSLFINNLTLYQRTTKKSCSEQIQPLYTYQVSSNCIDYSITQQSNASNSNSNTNNQSNTYYSEESEEETSEETLYEETSQSEEEESMRRSLFNKNFARRIFQTQVPLCPKKNIQLSKNFVNDYENITDSFHNFDDEFILFSEELEASEDFSQDQTDIISTMSEVEKTATSNSQQNADSFSQCKIEKLSDDPSYLLDESFNQALIMVKGVTSNQTVQFSSFDISSIECSQCTYGLIQVIGVAPDGISTVKFTDIKIQDTVSSFYGAILVSVSESLKNEQAFQFIGERILLSKKKNQTFNQLEPTFVFSSSKLINNSAEIGGGLNAVGVTAVIQNSLFTNNKASNYGGGLYFYNSIPEIKQSDGTYSIYNTFLFISKTTFSGNEAPVGAALMVLGTTLGNTIKSGVVFQNNKASVSSQDIDEQPQSLTIMISNDILPTIRLDEGNLNKDGFQQDTKSTIIDQIDLPPHFVLGYPSNTTNVILPSGQPISSYVYFYSKTQEQIPYNLKFRIVPLNRNGQPVRGIQSQSQCKISGKFYTEDRKNPLYSSNLNRIFTQNYTSPNKFNFDSDTGDYNADNITIIFDPQIEGEANYLLLNISCDSIKIPVYNKSLPQAVSGYNTNYFLYVKIKTFPCQTGEYYTISANSADGKCIACAPNSNTYSVTEDSTECKGINSESMQEVTSTQIKLQPKYWRPYFSNDQVERCANYESNCLGGWSVGDDSCYQGHIGALCESCDLKGQRDGTSWAQSGTYTCGKCSEVVAQNSAIIVGISILTLLSMLVSVKGTYDTVEEKVKNQVKTSIGVLVRDRKGTLPILIKIFQNYFQIIQAISSYPTSLPSSLTSTLENVGNPVKSMSVSYDCFFLQMTDIETLYFRMIWALFIPLMYLSLFLLIYMFLVLLKKAPFKISIFYTTFIYMFIYLQPTLLGGFMSLASIRQISGYEWVQADMSKRFDTSTHQAWIGAFVVPNLIAWILLFPFGLLSTIYFKRQNLQHPEVSRRYGYLYIEYKQTAYFWEFVKIFQKELIIIFLIFYQDIYVVKGILVFFLVFFYGLSANYFRPYRSLNLNILDQQSTSICAISLCGIVLIYSANQNQIVYLTMIFYLIIGLMNFFFIIQMTLVLVGGFLISKQDKLDILREKIQQKYPDLVLKYSWLRPYLIVRSEIQRRVKDLWSKLRYETKQGIKRQRVDKSAPLFLQSSTVEVKIDNQMENNGDKDEKEFNDEKDMILKDYDPQPLTDKNQNDLSIKKDLDNSVQMLMVMKSTPRSSNDQVQKTSQHYTRVVPLQSEEDRLIQ